MRAVERRSPKSKIGATRLQRGVSRAAVVVALVLSYAVAVPPAADAATKQFVEFDDGTQCEVGMQNVHASETVAGDVSVAVDIRCRPPGGAPKDKQLVERVTAETTIGFSKIPPIPGLLPGESIGTCPRQTKSPHNWGTITCHQPSSASGYYTGTSNVTVTYLGVTEEVDVSRVNLFGPAA